MKLCNVCANFTVVFIEYVSVSSQQNILFLVIIIIIIYLWSWTELGACYWAWYGVVIVQWSPNATNLVMAYDQVSAMETSDRCHLFSKIYLKIWISHTRLWVQQTKSGIWWDSTVLKPVFCSHLFNFPCENEIVLCESMSSIILRFLWTMFLQRNSFLHWLLV